MLILLTLAFGRKREKKELKLLVKEVGIANTDQQGNSPGIQNYKTNNMKLVFILASLLLMVACKSGEKNTTSVINELKHKNWTVLTTEGSWLIFADKSRINTKLYEMSYLESISDNDDNPYFVLSGKSCKDCDENLAIFLLSPADTLKLLSMLPKYTYPDKEYDYENNQLIFDSKLFMGNCLISNAKSACLIWLQKTNNNN